MSKMKTLTLSLFCLLTTFVLFACDANKKLDQDPAEKAIKQFLSRSPIYLKVEAIGSIEPVSQFSEIEASSIVHFNYQDIWDHNPVMKFKFQRNMDKKWILMSLQAVEGVGGQNMSDWIRKNQNINIVAQ